jgi:ubiquinone biosynthesis monooxygenase Coq7
MLARSLSLVRGPPGTRSVARVSVRWLVKVSAESVARRHFDIVVARDELRAEHSRDNENMNCGSVPYELSHAPWHWLDREMSSNVAGETGAVCIYDGAAKALHFRSRWLGANVNASTVQFIEEHRATEAEHLRLFVDLLPLGKYTKMLPLWRVAGFTLGFLPALISERALFVTVEAVETFVEIHYGEQIEPLLEHGRCPELVALLQYCCADEVHHKEDAAVRATAAAGTGSADGRSLMERIWMRVVRIGSAVAAEAARRI